MGIVVLLVITVLFARGAWSVHEKAQFAKDNRVRAEKELSELTGRREALQEEISRLNTERGLEEELRQKFDIGREGEQLIVLIDPPEAAEQNETPTPTFLQRITSFFGFN